MHEKDAVREDRMRDAGQGRAERIGGGSRPRALVDCACLCSTTTTHTVSNLHLFCFSNLFTLFIILHTYNKTIFLNLIITLRVL